MHTQLNVSIVRIFATRGNIVGMGFLASERSILSCAHLLPTGQCPLSSLGNRPSPSVRTGDDRDRSID